MRPHTYIRLWIDGRRQSRMSVVPSPEELVDLADILALTPTHVLRLVGDELTAPPEALRRP